MDPSNLLTLMIWTLVALGVVAATWIVGSVVVRRLRAAAAIVDLAERRKS